MTATRYCSECPNIVTGKAKTCSPSCRAKRSRRLRRAEKQGGQNHFDPRHNELRDRMTGALDDEVHHAAREALAPIARASITEDTVQALARMVSLTPLAVAAIEEDLVSGDPIIRQRAYTLLMKYTVGHPAVVRPEEETQGQMVVNFNLPRPGDEIHTDGAAVEMTSVELRTCDVCAEEKPVNEFVSGSQRCQVCYDNQRAFAQRLLERTQDAK